tara:strand:- start:122 stop:367 length:246 start_codon:yes stop_codon:yes gene_type:complete
MCRVEGMIDFKKDSEYLRLFGDGSDEFMEAVYKKELGNNFEKVDNGIGVGIYESESDEETMEREGTDTCSAKEGRQNSERG